MVWTPCVEKGCDKIGHRGVAIFEAAFTARLAPKDPTRSLYQNLIRADPTKGNHGVITKLSGRD